MKTDVIFYITSDIEWDNTSNMKSDMTSTLTSRTTAGNFFSFLFIGGGGEGGVLASALRIDLQLLKGV